MNRRGEYGTDEVEWENWELNVTECQKGKNERKGKIRMMRQKEIENKKN